MAGHEPPKLTTGTALNLVMSAWSLTWAGLGGVVLVLILWLEAYYVAFDKEAQQYLHSVTLPFVMPGFGRAELSTIELQQVTLILFGIALICTGLAIMPLYQKDEPAAALAPESDASGA